MLHLQCLLWLQKAFHLSKLYNWLLFNLQYVVDMVKFIDNIICYLMADILDSKETSQKVLSVSLAKTDEEFALKLHKNNNTVASTTQIYFFLHNVTCFKYGAIVIRKY